MNMIYRYRLNIGEQEYTVHPVYKDDMAIDWQHETSEMFMRGSLSSKLDFVGEDASLIIGAPFTTEYVLTFDSSVDGGLTWAVYYQCKFFQTDCTIDIDNLRVTVKPAVKDRYQKVLDGLDKEFNLIELKPVIEPIRMYKRGVVQVYTLGDRKATNIYGGMSWEQDFDVDGDIQSRYAMKRIFDNIHMTFENPPVGLSGRFDGIRNENGEFRLENGEGVYYIKRQRYSVVQHYITQIIRISDDEVIWQADGEELSMEFTRVITHVQDLPYHVYSTGYEFGVFCRWLCDVPEVIIDGVAHQTMRLQQDDPNYGGNLNYALPYNTQTIVQSNRTSTTPTQWGRMNQTEYFNTPADDVRYYIPVGRSQWINYSVWYYQNSEELYMESRMRKSFFLRDTYPLYSVIQVLLSKLETGITFDGTAQYSEFFYGQQNPLDSQFMCKPFISPKSNIIVGEYSEPAMKAPITLGTVFNMLKKAFGCYWFIDEQNRLRIEHISWFKNGGSYSMIHQIGIDLTALEQPTNHKRWSFGKNVYQYDKEQMAKRYQYKWMDDGTDIFKGTACEIDSPFVQTDKVEEVSISNFTSDVDYMLIAPEMCSKDGFALLLAENDGDWYLPIVYRGTAYHITNVQNWWASITYLMPNFLSSDLPAWNYSFNDWVYRAKGIQRSKKQQLPIPVGNTQPDLMKLVRTGIGDGQIDKMSINLASRMANTTLKYDTYDNE